MGHLFACGHAGCGMRLIFKGDAVGPAVLRVLANAGWGARTIPWREETAWEGFCAAHRAEHEAGGIEDQAEFPSVLPVLHRCGGAQSRCTAKLLRSEENLQALMRQAALVLLDEEDDGSRWWKPGVVRLGPMTHLEPLCPRCARRASLKAATQGR